MHIQHRDLILTEAEQKALRDYFAWTHTTAVYPSENATAYLEMGLWGEIGELANKIKKVLRGDTTWDDPAWRAAAQAELGDVFWYVSESCRDIGHTPAHAISSALAETGVNGSERDRPAWVQDATRSLLSEFFIDGYLRQALLLCVALDFDLIETLQLNREKLTSRQARGAIQGDGDNR